MAERKWGCPMCGSGDVTAIVQARGTQRGQFDRDGDFCSDDDDGDIEDTEIDGIAEYHCNECQEDFDKPGLVYNSPGARMIINVRALVVPLVEGMDDKTYIESDKEEVKPINIEFDVAFESVEKAFGARETAMSLFQFLGNNAQKEGK